jgi:hypothetical protein
MYVYINTSGQAIVKNLDVGNLYLNFITFNETFLNSNFWVNSPPGAHVPEKNHISIYIYFIYGLISIVLGTLVYTYIIYMYLDHCIHNWICTTKFPPESPCTYKIPYKFISINSIIYISIYVNTSTYV